MNLRIRILGSRTLWKFAPIVALAVVSLVVGTYFSLTVSSPESEMMDR